jgi:membrane protein
VTQADATRPTTIVGGEREESPLAAVRDYAGRLWRKGGRDDLFFLAGGVAFSIVLAGVPFFLLLASGLGYVLNDTSSSASAAVVGFLQALLPDTMSGDGSVLDPVMQEVVGSRGSAGLYGAILFVWFSTRLFGAMRSVLTHVFEEESSHGIVWGKLLDVYATLVSTGLIVAWIIVSTYLALARSSGVALLSEFGLHTTQVMGPVMYVTGRILASVLLGVVFFALYKLLPRRHVRWQQAAIGGIASAVLFEIARTAYSYVVHHFDPASIYSGTLAAVIVVVFWTYYAALVFVFGGEVAQVYEQRHIERTMPDPQESL